MLLVFIYFVMKNFAFTVLQNLRCTISLYFQRLSAIAGNMVNCAAILSWFEVKMLRCYVLCVLSIWLVIWFVKLIVVRHFHQI